MKTCFAFCLLLLSLNAYGALHKWVDADGNIHYSDAPPPVNAKEQKVNVKPIKPGTPSSKSVAERDADYRKAQKAKQETEEKSARQQEEAQIKKQNCERAQQNLRTLEVGGPVVTYDSKGERSYLDDTTRQQRIEEARKSVSNHCN